MIEFLYKLGKSVCDTHDNLHALRQHQQTEHMDYESMPDPNKYMIAGPFEWLATMASQFYAIVDEHECAIVHLTERLDELETNSGVREHDRQQTD